MQRLLTEFGRLLHELEQYGEDIIINWAPLALRNFTDLLRWMAALFVFLATLALGGNALFHTRWISGGLGIAYFFFVLLWILPSRNAMRSGLLAVGVDAGIDAFHALMPFRWSKLKNLAELDINLQRTTAFATLKLVAQFFLAIVLATMAMLWFFMIVPVWWFSFTTVVIILFSSIFYGLLKTPWGKASLFGRMSHVVGAVAIVIAGYDAWPNLLGVLQAATNMSWDVTKVVPLPLIGVGIIVYLLISASRKTGAGGGH